MPIRVFLVQGHELVRVGLRTLIDDEDDLVVVGETDTSTGDLSRLSSARTKVAVVDLQIDGGQGLEVCRTLRSAHPEVRCLLLSAFSDEDDAAAAMQAGAAGYILHQRAGKDILDAIRTVAGGGTILDHSIGEAVLSRIAAGGSSPLLQRLSAQERRILDRIAEGCTNRQIATELALAEATVRNYVSNLLGKLGMHRRSEAAAFAARLAERGELHDGPGDKGRPRG